MKKSTAMWKLQTNFSLKLDSQVDQHTGGVTSDCG